MKRSRLSLRPRAWFGWLTIVLLGSVLLFSAYSLRIASRLRPLPLHSTLPSSTVSSLTNDSIAIDSLVKSTCILFWFSTRCPLCRPHVFHFDSLARSLAANKHVIAFSSDPMDVLSKFRLRYSLCLPIYRMDREESRRRYHIVQFPTVYFIDDRRKIVRVMVSNINHDTLHSLIRSYVQ